MLAEERLIRYCAQTDINSDIRENIREAIKPGLNWDYFFKRAASEKILSLVYVSLRGIDDIKHKVPEDIQRRLKASYYIIAGRNILLYERLNKLLNLFNRSGIEVIVLKGMDLAKRVYSDIALRPIYDIDILIRKEDFSLVETKLREIGYNNSAAYPEDFRKNNMMVDVHWELLNVTRVKSRKKTYQMDINEAWNSSLPIEIDGEKTRVLSPECCLMQLCLHLSLHHGLEGMIWFVDIIRFVEHYKDKINWNRFTDKCIEFKICRPVYHVFFCIKKMFAKELLPEDVLNILKPERRGFLERKVINSIISGSYPDNIRFYFNFLYIDGLLNKLTFLREIALPPLKVFTLRYQAYSYGKIVMAYFSHFKSIFSSMAKLTQKFFSLHKS